MKRLAPLLAGCLALAVVTPAHGLPPATPTVGELPVAAALPAHLSPAHWRWPAADVPAERLPPTRLGAKLESRAVALRAFLAGRWPVQPQVAGVLPLQSGKPVPAPVAKAAEPTPAPTPPPAQAVALRPGQIGDWADLLVRQGVFANLAEAHRVAHQVCGVPQSDVERAGCWVDLVTWAHDALVVGVGLGERGQTPPRHRKRFTTRELKAQATRLQTLEGRALLDVSQALRPARLHDSAQAWLVLLGPARWPMYRDLLAGLAQYRQLASQPMAPLPADFPVAGPYAYKLSSQALRYLTKFTPAHREALRNRLCFEGYCGQNQVAPLPGAPAIQPPGGPAAVAVPSPPPTMLPSDAVSLRMSRAAVQGAGALQLDADLDARLRAFQADRGLRASGLVDAATLQALRTPIAKRIQQLRLALQRVRDSAVPRGPQFLFVNIPAFRVDLWRSNEVVRSHAVQVGQAWEVKRGRRIPGKRTPLLTARVTDLVLDPAWYVPGSILGEVFDEFQKDPSYAARNKFQYRKVAGAGDEPMLVMGAGPENLLGQVKFNFPNPHLVFAHDTTSRWRFLMPERMTSHGCVRVHKAPDMARDILAYDQGVPWTEEKWQQVRRKGDEVSIRLRKPLDIHLMYLTADTAPGGKVRFYRDFYAMDDTDWKKLTQSVASRSTPVAVAVQ